MDDQDRDKFQKTHRTVYEVAEGIASPFVPEAYEGVAKAVPGLLVALGYAALAADEIRSAPHPETPAVRTTQSALTAATHGAKLGGAPSGVIAGLGAAAKVADYFDEAAAFLRKKFGRRLDPVEFEFTLFSKAVSEPFEVRGLRFTEALSVPYEIDLLLETEDLAVEAGKLLGCDGQLLIARDVEHRTVFGIIDQACLLESNHDRTFVRVRIVPAFKQLQYEVDTRIFQGATVPEILTEVLRAGLAPFHRSFDASRLRGKYNARDYCVQFRESTFDFCCRLMAEEGIAYVFEPDEKDIRREKLVLLDRNDLYPDIDLLDSEWIPIIVDRPEEADRESIQSLSWNARAMPNAVTCRGYNWKGPTFDEHTLEQPETHHHRAREVYLHDDDRQIVDDPTGDPRSERFTGEALHQRRPVTQHALERLRTMTAFGTGRSNVTSLMPGRRFGITDHGWDELLGRKFLLTSVTHTSGRMPDTEGSPDEENPSAPKGAYNNEFVCIPQERPFRPQEPAPRPRVYGAQTAIVVGPEGCPEDVHTDPYGRVKVRFHWDRTSPHNDTSSCWVRVGTAWAGPGFGTSFIPRIGMEVIVNFLDGNPDRPIITGCVYNGKNLPPYALPDERTRSGILTRSTPAGDSSSPGFNELRFEDAKGQEEIFVHAQRNLTTKILACEQRSIGASQQITIGGNASRHVKQRNEECVDGFDSRVFSGGQLIHISSGVSDETDPEFDYASMVEVLGKRRVWAKDKLLTEVGEDESTTKATLTPTSAEFMAKDEIYLGVGGTSAALTPKSLAMGADEEIRLTVGGGKAKTTLTPKGITVDAEKEIRLMVGQASITLEPDKIMFMVGASLIQLTTQGITISGAQTTITGHPIHLNPPA